MGHKGSGSTRYSGELAARAAGNIELLKVMESSIGQYAPAFLPGEPLSLTEQSGRLQATGVQRASRIRLKQPCTHRCKTFFAYGSSALVRVEHDGGAAAWFVGILAAPSVQGHRLPPPQELWPYPNLSLSLL